MNLALSKSERAALCADYNLDAIRVRKDEVHGKKDGKWLFIGWLDVVKDDIQRKAAFFQ